MNNLDEEKLSKILRRAGRKGGKAGTGKSKARSSAQARKASLARWAKKKTPQPQTT